MDPMEHEQWIQDREDSADEMEVVIANHARILHIVATEDDELQSIYDRRHGGSRIGRGPNLKRDHVEGHKRIMRDYFSEHPKYPDHIFRRRFRMRRHLFLKIHDRIVESCPYFVQKPDAIGNPGLNSIQKIVAAMRMLTNGVAADSVDEYVQIGESTAIESFKEFVAQVVNLFEAEYMQSPTEEDVRKHMDYNMQHGFPGMFGSLDCTHWTWKNCLYSLQGQYRDKDGQNSIILEAIATANLWIWHAFIGVPGSANDINVIDRSTLLVNMLNGVAPTFKFRVNGNEYDMFYLLCDGIYPEYTIFVKPIHNPEGAKHKYFAKRQEACKKDIERCFGVLQQRFAMVQNPSNWWDHGQMITVWKSAIILHNMIVEDKETSAELNQDYLFESGSVVHINKSHPRQPLNFSRLKSAIQSIRNENTVHKLQLDLISHLWEKRGVEDKD